MTELWTPVSFGLLWAVALYPMSRRLMPPRPAVFAALATGFAVNILFSGFPVTGMIVAWLEPLPLTLAVYAAAFLAGPFGLALQPWPKTDLVLTLLAGFLLMLSAVGVLPIDLYRYGYEALPVALMAVSLALMALWRNHVLLCLSLPLALSMWLLDIASSNFFDHVFHVLWFAPLIYKLAVRTS